MAKRSSPSFLRRLFDSPERFLAGTFAGLILAGALLLMGKEDDIAAFRKAGED